MRPTSTLLGAAVLILMIALPALALESKGTAAEAVAMVGRAVALIEAEGTDKAFAAITARDPRFLERDLYVIVYSRDGRCLAHGINPKVIGKDLSENQDIDGKFYVKERLDLAARRDSFWHHYKLTNPTTGKVEQKFTYCEVAGEAIVCVGIYR